MTTQYEQPNINRTVTRGARFVSADADVTQDDDLIVANSSLNTITLTLYEAAQYPGVPVYIKAPAGASNTVTIAAAAGETIDGNASVTLTTDGEAVILKAQENGWTRVGDFGASSGGGAQGPDLSVGGYATYNSETSPPLSEGIRILTNAPADPFQIILAGYGFADGDTIDLQPVGGGPPPAVPATLSGAATYTDPSGTTAGSIIQSITGHTSADAIGIYTMSVTNSAGLIGSIMIEIAAPPA